MNKYVYTLSYMRFTSSVYENETMLWLGVVIDIRVCTSPQLLHHFRWFSTERMRVFYHESDPFHSVYMHLTVMYLYVCFALYLSSFFKVSTVKLRY